MATSINTKLAQLDKNWDDIKEEFGDQTGGLQNPPSGPYVVHKVKAELGVSQSSGNLMVKRNVTVKEGDHEGEKCFDNMQLETERGKEFLLKWLNLMSYKVDSLKKDLPDTLKAISENEDATFGVSIKTDPESNLSNIYFNKVIDEGELDDGEHEEKTSSRRSSSKSKEELPDLDEMSLRKLKKFIKDNDLDVDTEQDEDDIRDSIEEAWKEKNKEDEKEKPSRRRRTAGRKSSDDEKSIQGLKDLCDAFGIKYNKTDDIDDFKKTLDGYEFKEKELEESEVKLLEEVELDKIIK